MAQKNKKNRSTQKSPSKPSKETSKRIPNRGWSEETSADIRYDESIESPRGRPTPSMFSTRASPCH